MAGTVSRFHCLLDIRRQTQNASEPFESSQPIKVGGYRRATTSIESVRLGAHRPFDGGVG